MGHESVFLRTSHIGGVVTLTVRRPSASLRRPPGLYLKDRLNVLRDLVLEAAASTSYAQKVKIAVIEGNVGGNFCYVDARLSNSALLRTQDRFASKMTAAISELLDARLYRKPKGRVWYFSAPPATALAREMMEAAMEQGNGA